MKLNNDQYNREVYFETDGIKDYYTVIGENFEMKLSFPKGTDIEKVYYTINSMAPAVEEPIEE